MARTVVLDSQGTAKSTDMVTEPTPDTVQSSAITRVSPSKAPVTSSQQPPKASSDIGKEKRLTLQKSSTELRRPSRRIIRPQFVIPEEPPQGDVEMPEAEGAGDEGPTIVPPVPTLVRKRPADSLASETQGETNSEISPPASKKSKPDATEGENLSKEQAIDESMDATNAADGENEETDEEKIDESMEAQQENEDEVVEENPTETEEEFKDETEQEDEDLLTAVEEGEVNPDTLEDFDDTTDGGEVQPETVASSKKETTIEEAETTIEPRLEEGDVSTEEASDKPNNGNDLKVAETDIKPEVETTDVKPEPTVAASSSVTATPVTPATTQETEETKRAGASPSGTLVTLSERAKENSARRQARLGSLGGGTSRAPTQAPRGRGRVVNPRGSGRLVPRGGRAPRGGRGQSPNQP